MEIDIAKKLNDLKERSIENKGKEYKWFYARLSFALVRDGHLSKIKPGAFTVYLVIFCFKNRENISYPSLSTIRKLSGVGSVNTVRKSIKVLEKYGWINRSNLHRGNNGKFQNTKYTLLQTDLIRSSETKAGFIEKPISNIDYGE